jgi:outer membrane protein TolC
MSHLAMVRYTVKPAGLLFGLLVGLAGCTTYKERPLPEQAALTVDVDTRVKAQNLSAPYQITTDDGLDLTEVSILAVTGSPELKARRELLQVANAEAFAAGLLPDPSLNLGREVPTSDEEGLVTGTLAELGYDISALLTRTTRVQQRQYLLSQNRLAMLWEEWQTIEQAQLLAVQNLMTSQRLQLLSAMQDLYASRYQKTSNAVAAGTVTADVIGNDLGALLDTLNALNQEQQSGNTSQHALHLLLGVQADAPINLSALPAETLVDRAIAQVQLAHLSALRPDLMALAAGYEAQENDVRAAILDQFPALSLLINQATDTSNLTTHGMSIGLTLPLLNGNRGNIAVASATRELLWQEYQARLAQTDTDVHQLLALQDLVEQQRAGLRSYLPALQSQVENATAAYERGDIDSLSYTTLTTTLLNRQLDLINLQQNHWEIQIALQSMLALSGTGSFAADIAEPVVTDTETLP